MGPVRGRVISLAIVATLPIIAMAGTIAWQNFQSIARGAQERAALLDGQSLAQYHVAIGLAAGRLEMAALDLADPACRFKSADSEPGFLGIDAEGKTVCRLGKLPPDPPLPHRWLEQVRGGQQIALGRYGQSGWTVIAIPGPSGSILAEVMPPSWFAAQVIPGIAERGDAVWLLDGARSVVASRGDAAEALPTGATMATLIGADQLALRARSAVGGRYAYATTALPTGWRIITATSARRESIAATRALLVQLAELGALLLAGLATVVVGADVAFGQPLRRLSTAVRHWQAGAPFDPGELAGAPDEVQQLATSFREATGVLRQKTAELARAREQQDLLVMEVHHRVKNNLQVIASLLNLQSSRIRMPEAQAEFQAARDRIRALATLHRHLYVDGELHTINMRSFLTELCGQLLQAMGEKPGGEKPGGENPQGERIQMVIDAPELRLTSDQAVPLALIVTEAVTNSVRYAFPGGRSGRVEVSLTESDGNLDLVISDDGVGIKAARPEPGAGTRDGIGLQLIRGFSRQLGASLSIEEGQGTRYAVRLAASAGLSAKAVGLGRALDTGVADRETAA